jgi:endonuclease/exonuclease/phosphatase family metal-dependent hydrolase
MPSPSRLALPLCAVMAACAPGGARELRLATFNVHNLTASDPPSKRRGVIEILEAVDADVLLLEEVGGAAALAGLAAGSYPYRVELEGNDQRGFGLALLSSLAPVRAKSHRDDRFGLAGDTTGREYRYTRDCLEVHFDLPAGRLALLGVHFRAQLADDPERRLAEAEHTRQIADQLVQGDPELRLVVLGDFNDVPGSAPMDALLGPEPPFSSVASTLPAAESWTIEAPGGQGEGQLFDDLLVNPPLGAALRRDSVSVLHDHDLVEELAGVSDHAPVVASFRVGEGG